MTTLGFRTDQYDLSEANEGIGEVVGALASELPRHGYSNVKNEGHVFAVKSGCLVDVFYLFIGGRTFWQVVTCSGPDHATTDGVMEEVKAIVRDLHFL